MRIGIEGVPGGRRRFALVGFSCPVVNEMISCARDHSLAESFGFFNALQPGVYDPDDVARAAGAQTTGIGPTFEDLSPIWPTIG